MVVHAYGPNTWEAEKGETGVAAQFVLLSARLAWGTRQNPFSKMKKELRSSGNLTAIKHISNLSLFIGFLMYSRHWNINHSCVIHLLSQHFPSEKCQSH